MHFFGIAMKSDQYSSASLAGAVSLVSQARSSDERLESLKRLISEARAEIDGIEAAPRVFTAELEHPRHGIYKIGVDPESLDGTTGSLMDISLALLTSAARMAASRSIDPRSFDTHSEHEAAIAKRAASFQIIGIRHSEDAFRWIAKGVTAQGEPFETYVYAVDEPEADFQARWHAATLKRRAPIELETLPGFLGSLYEVSIEHVEPRPVDLSELAKAASDLIDHIRGFGGSELTLPLVSSAPFTTLEDMLSKIEKAGVPHASEKAAQGTPAVPAPEPVVEAPPAFKAAPGPQEQPSNPPGADSADDEPEPTVDRQPLNIDLPHL
jgi:hypothetical protein